MRRVTYKKWMLFAALAATAALFCACGAREGGEAFLGENIWIDGVNVSRLRLSEARALLEKAHEEELRRLHFTITVENDAVEVSGIDLPVTYNEEEVLLRAAALKPHYPGNNTPRTFSCTPRADAEGLRTALRALLASYNAAPENASATFDENAEDRFVYTEERAGRAVDVAPLAAALKSAIEGGAEGTNSRLTGAGAGNAPQSGETRFTAKVDTLEPTYTVEDARADTALVASFSTSFKGSVYGKKNRVFNIKKAAGLLSGVVVLPGEEFDMNRTLGDRNGENGWKEAAAIRDATYVQEYGGGVCQVSTTLYNAVLMAGLTVTERWHHSWPLGYVDIGRDATISTGGPNFKFKNETETAVVLYAWADTEKKNIHVELYGRKDESGLTVKLKSYKVSTLEDLGEDVVLDKSLPLGTREVVREKRIGSIAETYREVYDATGNLVNRELVVRDKYRSVKGLVMVSQDIYYGAAAPSPTP